MLYFDTHDGHVVVGLCTITVTFHFGLQDIHYLLGILEVGMSQDIEHVLIAELLVILVLRLIESICINQERMPLNRLDFLAYEFDARPQTDRCV